MRFLAVIAPVLMLALGLSLVLAAPVAAHNAGHVTTGNGGCVNVGGGNSPPEGNAFGTAGHPRGVHHAIHAGPNDKSAVEGGGC